MDWEVYLYYDMGWEVDNMGWEVNNMGWQANW